MPNNVIGNDTVVHVKKMNPTLFSPLSRIRWVINGHPTYGYVTMGDEYSGLPSYGPTSDYSFTIFANQRYGFVDFNCPLVTSAMDIDGVPGVCGVHSGLNRAEIVWDSDCLGFCYCWKRKSKAGNQNDHNGKHRKFVHDYQR